METPSSSGPNCLCCVLSLPVRKDYLPRHRVQETLISFDTWWHVVTIEKAFGGIQDPENCIRSLETKCESYSLGQKVKSQVKDTNLGALVCFHAVLTIASTNAVR